MDSDDIILKTEPTEEVEINENRTELRIVPLLHVSDADIITTLEVTTDTDGNFKINTIEQNEIIDDVQRYVLIIIKIEIIENITCRNGSCVFIIIKLLEILRNRRCNM